MLTSDKMNTTACFHIILQQDNKKYLYNLNMVAKKLFEFLCSEKGLTEEKLTLCTDEGFVLSSFPGQSIQNIVHEKVDSNGKEADFIILASSKSERLTEISDLQCQFTDFLSIFCHNEQVRDYIFCGLDSLPVSICIYDKNTRLVYANADFCDYVQIKDREAVYGMRLD